MSCFIAHHLVVCSISKIDTFIEFTKLFGTLYGVYTFVLLRSLQHNQLYTLYVSYCGDMYKVLINIVHILSSEHFDCISCHDVHDTLHIHTVRVRNTSRLC